MRWTTVWMETVVPLLSVLTPLVGVPLTLITFYLRSLREHQVSWHADQVRRLDAVETAARELRATMREFERDYTTKEEWLRECMQARRTLARLVRVSARLEALELSASRVAGTDAVDERRCSREGKD